MKALRRYFMADDDEAIHWSDYIWMTAGYGLPIIITLFTIIAV